MRRPVLTVLLFVLASLGGCVDDDPTAQSFTEAGLRFTDDGEGPYAFQVPDGNVTLVVAVHYVLEPEATLMAALVVEATHTHLAALDQVGPVDEKDDRWVVIRNATAGPWHIEADLEGQGDYVFAVSFEPRA